MVSALLLHPWPTTPPQLSCTPGAGVDATTDPSKGRHCLPLPKKWKLAVPTFSAFTITDEEKM